MSKGIFSPPHYFLKDLGRAGIVSSLNVGSHQWNHLLVAFLCWKFFDSISFLIISLCRFLVSLLFILGRVYVLGIDQFHLSYPSLFAYIIHSQYNYNYVYFCRICNCVTTLIFVFLFVIQSSLFFPSQTSSIFVKFFYLFEKVF